MNKRILLIGYNYYPETTGIGKYSGEMIAWLAQSGYDCEVVTSYPYYPQWEVQNEYCSRRNWYFTEYQYVGGGRVKINRCPMYVPKVPSGIKRILLDLSFLLSAFLKIFQLLFEKKFDYVITVVPCFQFGLLGLFYKKLRKAILLYHIQDMQIEAARDLKMIKSQLVLNTLFRLEKFIFSQSDVISSVSEGMVRKIRMKAKKDVYLFENWIDCKLFYPLNDRTNLKIEFGYKPSDKVILYSGAIGEKQGLEAVLYAAKSLECNHNIKFLICGSGPYKQKLVQLSEELGINNVEFFPLQPLEKFNLFLNMADVHLIVQKSNASDLVMPSKLTSILGVGGLALITAHKGTSLYSSIKQNNIGLLVDPESQQALNKAIWKAVTGDYNKVRKNARYYAEEHLSIDKIMKSYVSVVLTNQPKLQDNPPIQHEPLLSAGAA